MFHSAILQTTLRKAHYDNFTSLLDQVPTNRNTDPDCVDRENV
jgi:hypothetical protein